ncbi:MAG: hypothetical protein LBQ68_00385 [Clostridiales bacterium]|jgi:hypothetical protein|nr:hypothetical protein [Clostridiales bacterium]
MQYYHQTLNDIPADFKRYQRRDNLHRNGGRDRGSLNGAIPPISMMDQLFVLFIFLLIADEPYYRVE